MKQTVMLLCQIDEYGNPATISPLPAWTMTLVYIAMSLASGSIVSALATTLAVVSAGAVAVIASFMTTVWVGLTIASIVVNTIIFVVRGWIYE